MTIQITSSAFAQGHAIPKKYTGDGVDVAALELVGDSGGNQGVGPDLRRSRCPAGGALGSLGDLQDSGRGEGFAGRRAAQVAAERAARRGAGKNSWPASEAIGYRGPYPPQGHGVHHYYFKLYALDAPLDEEPGLDKKALIEKIKAHVLTEGVLMGTYER